MCDLHDKVLIAFSLNKTGLRVAITTVGPCAQKRSGCDKISLTVTHTGEYTPPVELINGGSRIFFFPVAYLGLW